MRLFLAELKKIWDWRMLLVIVALIGLVWFGLVKGLIDSASDFTGPTGDYLLQLHEAYGDTLSDEEWEDFDAGRVRAEAEAAFQAQFQANPLFAKYDIASYEQWQSFEHDAINSVVWSPARDVTEMQEDYASLLSTLYETNPFDVGTPWWRLGQLDTLADRYDPAQREHSFWWRFVESQQDLSDSPLVRERAGFVLEHMDNLFDPWIASDISSFVGLFCGISLVAVALLVSPLLVTDRARKVRQIQYTSHEGRAIVGTQLLAVIATSLIVSAVLTGAGLMVYIFSTQAHLYWTARIAGPMYNLWMYNLTLGNYVFLLGALSIGLNVAVACGAFALSLHSTSLVAMFLKVVPLVAAVVTIGVFALSSATSVDNVIFSALTRSRLPLPEVWLCVLVLAAGLAMAVVLARHQRHIEV
ncbi:MAG: hypothetical protein LBN10_08855 [Propionibacteriaceae bacterium]|jgi:hypothetical protein|nr:hypothetical protein [Propionibacteriaceae bacterium]